MKILVAIEDKLFGDAIARFVSQSTWPENSEITVLHVMEPLPVDALSGSGSDRMRSLHDQRHQEANDLLRSISTQLASRFPYPTIKQEVLEGSPKEVILSVARDWPAELIVMGSHGRSGLGKFFLGSVSMSVLSASPCTITIVKLPDSESKGKVSEINEVSRATAGY